MATVSFSGEVDEWVRQTSERMSAVFKRSSELVIAEMQKPVAQGGLMPIDSGFLRASLQVAVNQSLPPMNRANPNPDGSFGYSPVAIAVLAGAKIGDTVTAGYTANYARYVHDGAQGRAPRPFVTYAAAQWQQFVNQATAEAKGAVGG